MHCLQQSERSSKHITALVIHVDGDAIITPIYEGAAERKPHTHTACIS